MSIREHCYPLVTVILTVHNEELLVRKRVNNILESEYPPNHLEVLIASDKSTDETESIVKSMSRKDGRIRLFKGPGGGKSFTQSLSIPTAKGEIIVLTDAAAIFKKDMISNLTRRFADDKVGCVSGRVVLLNKENGVSECQGMYWKYETLLRRLESRFGILHTASGQAMAFRKKLFKPFKSQYGDDCIIPLDILKQGYKVIHANDALVYDCFPSSMLGELKARIRMTLRNITCTLSMRRLLNPFKYPLLSVAILSHKIFRWLTPYFLIALFISNLCLLDVGVFYKLTFAGQLIFYIGGAVGFVAHVFGFRVPLASHAFSFLLANVGFFIGVLKAAIGREVTYYSSSANE